MRFAFEQKPIDILVQIVNELADLLTIQVDPKDLTMFETQVQKIVGSKTPGTHYMFNVHDGTKIYHSCFISEIDYVESQIVLIFRRY